jgi:hypothetical protein
MANPGTRGVGLIPGDYDRHIVTAAGFKYVRQAARQDLRGLGFGTSALKNG